jgi:AbrB family looped-hinge helix DNA binding protein
MIVTKIGRRGQITVPKEIQRLLSVHEGDRVAFIQRGNEVVLRPLSRTLKELRGSVPVSGPQDFDAIRRRVIAKHARKVAIDEA